MSQQWKPIASAPKDGTSILAWGPQQDAVVIAWNEWALPEAEWRAVGLEANGFECPTVVMRGEPTLWQPLPAAPCPTCNDQGAVGNILTGESCPDCTLPASAQDDAKDVEAVARAIWDIRREHEDRCDMELEDMGAHHPVWDEARAAVAAIAAHWNGDV